MYCIFLFFYRPQEQQGVFLQMCAANAWPDLHTAVRHVAYGIRVMCSHVREKAKAFHALTDPLLERAAHPEELRAIYEIIVKGDPSTRSAQRVHPLPAFRKQQDDDEASASDAEDDEDDRCCICTFFNVQEHKAQMLMSNDADFKYIYILI